MPLLILQTLIDHSGLNPAVKPDELPSATTFWLEVAVYIAQICWALFIFGPCLWKDTYTMRIRVNKYGTPVFIIASVFLTAKDIGTCWEHTRNGIFWLLNKTIFLFICTTGIANFYSGDIEKLAGWTSLFILLASESVIYYTALKYLWRSSRTPVKDTEAKKDLESCQT